VVFAGDHTVATAGSDGAVRLLDATTGTRRLLHRHDAASWALAAGPGGRLASGAVDGSIWVHAPGAGERVLRGDRHEILGLAFLPDGRLVSGDNQFAVRTWDIERTPAVPIDPTALATWLRRATSAIVPAPDGPRESLR